MYYKLNKSLTKSNMTKDKEKKIYNPTVTVCSKCLRCCCWHGEFMCDDAQSAKTVERKISSLVKLELEHPDYWNDDLFEQNQKLLTKEDLIILGVKDKDFLDLTPMEEEL